MTRRANWLLVFALAVVSLTVYYGCSQTDDILTPVKKTTLTLSTQLLPTAPAGMVYELWVAGENDTIPVGRFNFDQNDLIFLNENLSARAEGGDFVFDADLLAYSSVLVSVELTSNPAPTSPGPIMLMDAVTNPSDNPIRLVFPLSDSLWFATCRYTMLTPSDSNIATNNGAGVWFASFTYSSDSANGDTLIDTLGLNPTDSFTITVEQFDEPDSGKTTLTSIKAFGTVVVETVPFPLGLDTTTHIRVGLYDPIYNVDSTAPYDKYEVGPNYVLSAPRAITRQDYSQDQFGLFDYTSYGWHYKGWVLSPVIDSTVTGTGVFSAPAWPSNALTLFLGSMDGGMMTTGTFTDVEKPDNGNPYTAGPRVPPFPGEDFLQNLPAGLPEPLNLMPLAYGNTGFVFISLEPNNYTDTRTNFPLVALAAKLPSSSGAIVGGPYTHARWTVYQTMDNFINTNNPAIGFPRIDVSIVRE